MKLLSTTGAHMLFSQGFLTIKLLTSYCTKVSRLFREKSSLQTKLSEGPSQWKMRPEKNGIKIAVLVLVLEKQQQQKHLHGLR